MPTQQSFDVTTGCDLQEVDNSVNQAQKELAQRYDFRNVSYMLSFKRDENLVEIEAPNAFVLDNIFEILQAKLVKRGVPVKNFHRDDPEAAAHQGLRQKIKLQQVIDTETAKKIAKCVKDAKLKKVQASIQKDQVRISAPSRDDLQQMMQLLRGEDFGVELAFGNYR